MPETKHPRPLARWRWGAAAAVSVAAGGGYLLQRRHVRQIRDDPEYQRLEHPPRGRPLAVTSADGTELHAEIFGPEEGPTVVLAHGWTEGLQYWTYVIDELVAAGRRCVAFDLRGHGRSRPAAGGEYSLPRFGQDIEAVLAASLGDGQRATVVGHSLGAMSVVAWAADHDVARRATSAALCNTGVSALIADNVVLPLIAGRLKESLGRVFMGAPGALPRISTPLTHAAVKHLAFGPEGSPAKVAFYERMLWECSPKVRASIGVALSTMDLSQDLARLQVPTVVLAGGVDRLTPPAHAHRIAEHLPRCAGVVELPETGHMAPLERPVEVAQAILDKLFD